MRLQSGKARLFVAGSITAATALLATIPFNMGGCSAGNLDYGQIVKGVTTMGKSAALDQRQERAMGESVSLAVTNHYGVSNNERLERYVVLVGRTVAAKTPMKNYPWVFGVLDTEEVNAFSGPGGYVWVTRGAIEQMQDESELAGVLAHEVGHVNLHHGLDVVKKAGLLNGFLTAASASDKVAQFNQASDTAADLVIKQGFSAPQEFEADAASLKYVAAAGYDPNGFLNFLERIRAKQKHGMSLFSTHPDVDDRIERVRSALKASHAGGHGASNRERFLKMTAKPGIAMAKQPTLQ